jgi:hypothetical protein
MSAEAPNVQQVEFYDYDGVINCLYGPDTDVYSEYRRIFLDEFAAKTNVPREKLVEGVHQITSGRPYGIELPYKHKGIVSLPRTLEVTTWHKAYADLQLDGLRGESNHQELATYRIPEPGEATESFLYQIYLRAREKVHFPLRSGAEDFLGERLEAHRSGRTYATILSNIAGPELRRIMAKDGLSKDIRDNIPIVGGAGKMDVGSEPLVLPPGLTLPRSILIGSANAAEVPLWRPVLYNKFQAIGRAAFGLGEDAVIDFWERPPVYIVDDLGAPLILANMLGMYAILFDTIGRNTFWERGHFNNYPDNNDERRYSVTSFNEINEIIER